jgi:hypothetical protein
MTNQQRKMVQVIWCINVKAEVGSSEQTYRCAGMYDCVNRAIGDCKCYVLAVC